MGSKCTSGSTSSADMACGPYSSPLYKQCHAHAQCTMRAIHVSMLLEAVLTTTWPERGVARAKQLFSIRVTAHDELLLHVREACYVLVQGGVSAACVMCGGSGAGLFGPQGFIRFGAYPAPEAPLATRVVVWSDSVAVVPLSCTIVQAHPPPGYWRHMLLCSTLKYSGDAGAGAGVYC